MILTIQPDTQNSSRKKTSGSGVLGLNAGNPHGEVELGSEVMQVAARLAALLGAENRVVLVTSYDESDGASDLAAQLAIGLSRVAQEQVALVDANRRIPSLHKMFGVPISPGFGELIDETAELSEVLRNVARGVSLIPAGNMDRPLPAPDCVSFYGCLRSRFRFVVVAAGPLLRTAETVTLSSLSDGVVLAVRAGLRSRGQVQELQRELGRFQAKLLGAVIREGK